jgi:hypothetical protein
VIKSCCLVLSNLLEGCSEENIDIIISSPLCPVLIQVMATGAPKLQLCALKIIGSLLIGNDTHCDKLLSLGVLPVLIGHLNSSRRALCATSAWALSNIAAGTPAQVDHVLGNSEAVQRLFVLLHSSDYEVRKECLWTLCNATMRGHSAAVVHMATSGFFPVCFRILASSSHTKMIILALEGLDNIFRKAIDLDRKNEENQFFLNKQLQQIQLTQGQQVGVQAPPRRASREDLNLILPQQNAQQASAAWNTMKATVEQLSLIETLDNLMSSPNVKIAGKAKYLLDTYFGSRPKQITEYENMKSARVAQEMADQEAFEVDRKITAEAAARRQLEMEEMLVAQEAERIRLEEAEFLAREDAERKDYERKDNEQRMKNAFDDQRRVKELKAEVAALACGVVSWYLETVMVKAVAHRAALMRESRRRAEDLKEEICQDDPRRNQATMPTEETTVGNRLKAGLMAEADAGKTTEVLGDNQMLAEWNCEILTQHQHINMPQSSPVMTGTNSLSNDLEVKGQLLGSLCVSYGQEPMQNNQEHSAPTGTRAGTAAGGLESSPESRLMCTEFPDSCDNHEEVVAYLASWKVEAHKMLSLLEAAVAAHEGGVNGPESRNKEAERDLLSNLGCLAGNSLTASLLADPGYDSARDIVSAVRYPICDSSSLVLNISALARFIATQADEFVMSATSSIAEVIQLAGRARQDETAGIVDDGTDYQALTLPPLAIAPTRQADDVTAVMDRNMSGTSLYVSPVVTEERRERVPSLPQQLSGPEGCGDNDAALLLTSGAASPEISPRLEGKYNQSGSHQLEQPLSELSTSELSPVQGVALLGDSADERHFTGRFLEDSVALASLETSPMKGSIAFSESHCEDDMGSDDRYAEEPPASPSHETSSVTGSLLFALPFGDDEEPAGGSLDTSPVKGSGLLGLSADDGSSHNEVPDV